MTTTAEKLRTELAALSASDRAELAHFLLLSLDDESEPVAGEAWDAELARRADQIKSGQVVGKPAEQLFAELRQRPS